MPAEQTKEEYCNEMQDKRLDDLEKKYDVIKDSLYRLETNHLNHIEKDVAATTKDVDWLKRFFWIIATASIGGLVTAVLNLILVMKQ